MKASPATLLRLCGAGALLASGGIHLDLYLTSYHSIPTIGPLFIAQTASAILLGLVLLMRSDALVLVSGAGFAASTLGGYVLSRWVGLFGFKEVPTTAGLVSGLLDCAAIVTLGWLATKADPGTAPPALRPALAPVTGKLGARGLALLVLAALALTFATATGGSTAPSDATQPAATAGSVKVTIENFAFTPARLTVAPGTVIEVVNDDTVAHTLTAMPGSSSAKFTTGNIAAGATATVKAPTTAGTYAYYCEIHNFMTGTLVVRS